MVITMNYACLLRSDSSLRPKHLVICTPETRAIVSPTHSPTEYQILHFRHQPLWGPQPTQETSMQKHAQLDWVENRSAGAAESSSTSSLAGRGIQKQRAGHRETFRQDVKWSRKSVGGKKMKVRHGKSQGGREQLRDGADRQNVLEIMERRKSLPSKTTVFLSCGAVIICFHLWSCLKFETGKLSRLPLELSQR